MSPRGGHKFSRSGPKFSPSKWGTYRNWSGRKWGGSKWSGGSRDWDPKRFCIPYALYYRYCSYWYYPSYKYRFGYPYYWGWYPYWGYPYWYYPSYWYVYDDCSVSRKRFLHP